MSAGNFDACLAFTLRPENDGQPYHVTANDPGGATAWGITMRTMSWFLQRTATNDDLQNLTSDQCNYIYQKLYWRPLAGDELPLGVDLLVFDFAVLAGVAASARVLQSVAGVTQDGDIGLITIEAVEHATDMLDVLPHAQIAHLRSLPDFANFGDGWLRRNADCVATAQQMVATISSSSFT